MSIMYNQELLIGNDDFECPSSDGVFPADDQCTGDYYLCVDGDSYIQVLVESRRKANLSFSNALLLLSELALPWQLHF